MILYYTASNGFVSCFLNSLRNISFRDYLINLKLKKRPTIIGKDIFLVYFDTNGYSLSTSGILCLQHYPCLQHYTCLDLLGTLVIS